MWIRPLGDADASCGAKARGLARMLAAGLRVPDGFVIDSAAFRAVAEVTVDGSGPRSAADGSGPRRAADGSGERFSADGGGPQFSADGSGPRRAADGSGERFSADGSSPRLTADGSGPRLTADGSGPRFSADGSGERFSADGSGPRFSADGSGPQFSADGSGPRLTADGSGPRLTADGSGERFSADGIGHALADAGERIARAEVPEEMAREVAERVAALGRVAVRSSASIEDGVEGAAAGVFSSVTDVAPGEVWDAIRAVWTSALTPLAVAYARRREAGIAIAVIVQRFVPGARVTVYTRPVGAPDGDELWIQRGEVIQRVPRAAAAEVPEAVAALAAEVAIDATGGADVELVIDPGYPARPWIVQARPMVHPVRKARRAPPDFMLAPLVVDGRRWTWDITHNPDPLSPAQAGLVAAVERAACTPYALQVCAGYLYSTPRDAGVPPVAPPSDCAELATRIAAIEARIVLDDPDGDALSVAEAVARYVAFMAIWACELSPLVAAARSVLLDRLARDGCPTAEIAARAAALIGPRGVLRDPVMSPAWDIAVPTFAERAPALTSRKPPRLPETPDALAAAVELARAAADAGETDDLWFARAQWMVRRALLAHGAALALREDDVFWLPLDDLVTARSFDPDDAQRRASAARAAFARAAAWDMPRVVHGDAREVSSQGEQLRGVGFGARVVGRVVRLSSLAASVTVERGDIVVTRAITPALAMVVDGCAALVSETGGLLDHGAALARELGIPCVVGCAGAWTQLTDGALIAVDGDAGVVSVA